MHMHDFLTSIEAITALENDQKSFDFEVDLTAMVNSENFKHVLVLHAETSYVIAVTSEDIAFSDNISELNCVSVVDNYLKRVIYENTADVPA